MNILFHSNQISERGTEIALFDYAAGNQNILKNRSFVASPKDRVFDARVLEKFEKNFEVCLYKHQDELNEFLNKNKIELIYMISHGGSREALISDTIPVFIHCVFSTKEKYGTFYCPISGFLNKWFRTKYPVLPHIVKQFPGNTGTLREELHIPQNAVVFGGYGGENSFDITFVHEVIRQTARQRKNIYFVFLNFKPFTNEELTNILFLPKNTDIDYKEKFINTCDAMIHARSDGETFGLAVAEFSIKNKPIITYTLNPKRFIREKLNYTLGKNYGYAGAHLEFLGKKAIKYRSKKHLMNIFLNFKTKYLKPVNYDCYSERFSERNVMTRFNEIINNEIK
jgi:hypothetical protein